MGLCDICGEQPQAIQLGNMDTGEQQFICVGCAARWGLDFAKAILPPEEIAAILGPMFVTPGRQEALDKGATKRGRKSKAKAEAEAETERKAGGAAEVAPAAADQ